MSDSNVILTDADVITALECCFVDSCCNGCPLYKPMVKECLEVVGVNAVSIINRQKAEIERLKKILGGTSKVLSETCAGVRVEAIKEFAARLKESAFACDVSFGYGKEHCEEAVTVLEIDRLVKEMTEETP